LDYGVGLRGGRATSVVAWKESLRIVAYSLRLSGVGFWLRRVQWEDVVAMRVCRVVMKVSQSAFLQLSLGGPVETSMLGWSDVT
jgi:hypothetical protein